MFVELIDTCGNKRYVNPYHIIEISRHKSYNDETYNWKIIFQNGCSYFTDYNIDKLIGQKIDSINDR